MRLKRECKTDFAPKIVSSEHPQPDHQQMPVKNCANSVRVPCGRSNVRGFKRDGSTFHQSEKSFFRKMRWRRYCRCDHRRNGAHHPRNARPCVPTPFYIPDHTWPPSRAEASFYVSPTSVALCQGGDSNPYGFLHQILSLARLPIPPPWRRCDAYERRCVGRFGQIALVSFLRFLRQIERCLRKSLPDPFSSLSLSAHRARAASPNPRQISFTVKHRIEAI